MRSLLAPFSPPVPILIVFLSKREEGARLIPFRPRALNFLLHSHEKSDENAPMSPSPPRAFLSYYVLKSDEKCPLAPFPPRAFITYHILL